MLFSLCMSGLPNLKDIHSANILVKDLSPLNLSLLVIGSLQQTGKLTLVGSSGLLSN